MENDLCWTFLAANWPFLDFSSGWKLPILFLHQVIRWVQYESSDVYPFPLAFSPWFFAPLFFLHKRFLNLIYLCGNTRLPCVVCWASHIAWIMAVAGECVFLPLILFICSRFHVEISVFRSLFLFSLLSDIFGLFRGVCHIPIFASCISGVIEWPLTGNNRIGENLKCIFNICIIISICTWKLAIF